MKTAIKSIVFALFFSTVFTTLAASPTETDSNFKITTYKIGSELKLKLNITKSKDLKVKVDIINSKKEVMYSTYVAKDETKHVFKFDLNELVDGKYSLEITDGVTTEVQEFSINTK